MDDSLKELDEALENSATVDELLNDLVAAGLADRLKVLDGGERSELFERMSRLVEVAPDELTVNVPPDFEEWLRGQLEAIKDRYRDAAMECKDVVDEADGLPDDLRAEFNEWRNEIIAIIWGYEIPPAPTEQERFEQLKTRIHLAHLTCKAVLVEAHALPLAQYKEFNKWFDAMLREVWQAGDVLIEFLKRKKTAVH